MILSPLQNTAVLQQQWIQKRPVITQKFGLRPNVYEQFGLKGHNGIDLRCSIGTPVFAPIDGKVTLKGSPNGYGKYIKIRGGGREVILAHLNKFLIADDAYVKMGDKIAESGNSGFSSGPHLHLGFRQLSRSQENIKDWEIADENNGYKGYIDILPYIINWKGGFILNNF